MRQYRSSAVWQARKVPKFCFIWNSPGYRWLCEIEEKIGLFTKFCNVKTFVWRAWNDSFPTRTKLFDRKISNSFSCVLCVDEAETCPLIFGVFICPSRLAAISSPLWNDCRLPSHINFIDAMEVVLKKLPFSDFETFYMACWMIWSYLNKLVFDNKLPSHKDL